MFYTPHLNPQQLYEIVTCIASISQERTEEQGPTEKYMDELLLAELKVAEVVLGMSDSRSDVCISYANFLLQHHTKNKILQKFHLDREA